MAIGYRRLDIAQDVGPADIDTLAIFVGGEGTTVYMVRMTDNDFVIFGNANPASASWWVRAVHIEGVHIELGDIVFVTVTASAFSNAGVGAVIDENRLVVMQTWNGSDYDVKGWIVTRNGTSLTVGPAVQVMHANVLQPEVPDTNPGVAFGTSGFFLWEGQTTAWALYQVTGSNIIPVQLMPNPLSTSQRYWVPIDDTHAIVANSGQAVGVEFHGSSVTISAVFTVSPASGAMRPVAGQAVSYATGAVLSLAGTAISRRTEPSPPFTPADGMIPAGLGPGTVGGDPRYWVGAGGTIIDMENPAALATVTVDPLRRPNPTSHAGDTRVIAGGAGGPGTPLGPTLVQLVFNQKPRPTVDVILWRAQIRPGGWQVGMVGW